MLKIIALILMTFDHIGKIFFEEEIAFHLFGRFSMPLFAYVVARSYFYVAGKGHLKRYIRNLLLLSIVSQAPHMLISDTFTLNVVFAYLAAVIFLDAFYGKSINKKILALSLCIMLSFFLDYFFLGIILVLIFSKFYFEEKRDFLMFLFFIGATAIYIVVSGNILQTFSIMLLPFLDVLKTLDQRTREYIKVPKQFFYVYYPLHMVVIKVLSVVI